MDLSPVKLEILEGLLLHEKPVRAIQVAVETGKDRPAVQMHLIDLVRKGVAESPARGFYTISQKGRKALGLPEVTRDLALKILEKVPHDRAFHFYEDIGKPLNVFAHDLLGFCDKMSEVDSVSIIFHLTRGDFEEWFRALGDLELLKKTALLKNKELPIEDLALRVQDMVRSRCAVLNEVSRQASYSG